MAERVVDACLAVKWVIRGEAWRKKARRFLADCLANEIDLIAPPLFEYEVESVIQKHLLTGDLDLDEADLALARLETIHVGLASHPGMVKRARELARRFKQARIYDSLYAALAELRGCEFWTADKRFCDAVAGHLDFVRHLPDYQSPADSPDDTNHRDEE